MTIQHHTLLADDGLHLHYSETGAENGGIPVVCLPGLTRPAADFDHLAGILASGKTGKARRVLALDYRGRGLSEWDKNPENYTLPVEHADMLKVLKAAGVERAIFIGTSRGGLQTMLTAAQLPQLIHAAVLNDIGPVIESAGLMRIKSYVGKFPVVTRWSEIIQILKFGMSGQFSALSDAEFETYAHLTFVEKDGQIVMRYDPALTATLANFDPANPIPPAWPLYEALGNVPVLILRGENSDLLSPETATEMLHRHTNAQVHVVAGQGHAPLLLDEPTCARVAEFVASVDP